MSDIIAWIKEQVRKSHIKELIKTHTGLTPPVFLAAIAFAAAGTALTVSAVSSLLAPPKKNDRLLDSIIEEEIMPYSPSTQNDVDVIPVFAQTPRGEAAKEEEEKEEEEKVEAPAKEDTVETAAPAATEGEDSISSDYVEFEEATTTA